MKTIIYKKKSVNANTEYRDIDSKDMEWVKSQARKLVDVAKACKDNGIKEGEKLNHKSLSIPRRGDGKLNTPSSICEGILDNLSGSQYNLSAPQCDGLEAAFKIGEEIISDFEQVVFTDEINQPASTYGDLFEITITVRKK